MQESKSLGAMPGLPIFSERVLKSIFLQQVPASSERSSSGLTVIVRDLEHWIMDHRQSEPPTDLGHTNLLAVEETPVIDESSFLEELSAEDEERSVRRIDLGFTISAI